MPTALGTKAGRDALHRHTQTGGWIIAARRIAANIAKLPELIRQRRTQALKLVERHFPPRLVCPGDGTPVTVGAYEQCR